ncbi:MAG: gliding motility-associated C-terminal domain-containing protein, partial [Tenacibaculum sp.]
SGVQIQSPTPQDITTTDLEAVGTITDNDSAPTISIDDVQVEEGSTATFTVSLSHASQHAVSFELSTSDVTSTAGSDYSAIDTSYTIKAGDTTLDIQIVTTDDGIYEPTAETYAVTLSGVQIQSPTPQDITTTDLEAVGTIIDKNDQCITIYNEFTPNGDGVNDRFVIKCIENERYRNNRLEIYNRWGNLIYSKDRYDNSWDGKSNGRINVQVEKHLPAGTYFYVLNLGDGSKPILGWIYINRE